MALLFRPCQGPCPGFGVRFHGICAMLKEQFHPFDTAPTARPAEWSALEEVISNIKSRARIEQRLRERQPSFRRQVLAEARDRSQCHHVMKECPAVRAGVGAGALEQ